MMIWAHSSTSASRWHSFRYARCSSAQLSGQTSEKAWTADPSTMVDESRRSFSMRPWSVSAWSGSSL